MMKIERPDWLNLLPMSDTHIRSALNEWFTEHVEPINKMLSEGVSVTGYQNDIATVWRDERSNCKNGTHKALLINIEPIKQETCADVLRDLVKIDKYCMGETNYERAKAALARDK